MAVLMLCGLAEACNQTKCTKIGASGTYVTDTDCCGDSSYTGCAASWTKFDLGEYCGGSTTETKVCCSQDVTENISA